MHLSVIYSRALAGVDAPLVQVETHLSNGLPAFHIVGLPETAVRESRDRVRCALLNSHFDFPDRRITVNLAPADLPKEGGRFDLPIALGILGASGQVPVDRLAEHEFLGELALDGTLRSVPGAVAAADAAQCAGRSLVVAPQCAPLAALAPASRIVAASDLLTVCAHLNGAAPIPPSVPLQTATMPHYPDMRDVVGQHSARRVLEIAAAGGHHLLLEGPPGSGKTLMASRLPGILPPPEPAEALMALALRDIHDGWMQTDALFQRPFRAPHHSASAAALAGGGSKPRPGEISLAHGGVLFLDEFPEFSRHCLEMLREPLESGEITLSRARHKVTYPARFQLVAAMNPCPCGYLGDGQRSCRCAPEQVQRYQARISGPLLDRIDLHAQVGRVAPANLLGRERGGEASDVIRSRVCRARERQTVRQGCANSQLPPDAIASTCLLEGPQIKAVESAAIRLHLSARSVHRLLRVALTISDLEGAGRVEIDHIREALGYRGPH